jgi:hypothetical protein
MSATRPPLSYLVTCSQMSLESVELARLNQAANLRKEFHQILEEWIDSEVDARLARSLLQWRRDQNPDADAAARIPREPEPARFEQLAIAFLPESSAPAAPESEPQLPGLNGRPERAAPANRARLLGSFSPRSTQLAKSAETKLREVETLAVYFPGQLRSLRQKVAATNAGRASRPGPAKRSRREHASVASPVRRNSVLPLKLVPLRAEHGERERSAPKSNRGAAQVGTMFGATPGNAEPKATQPATPAPCAIRFPRECVNVHFHARHAG